MLGKLLVGVALGFVGKKLYDEGKFDPYLSHARDKLDEFGKRGASNEVPVRTKTANTPV